MVRHSNVLCPRFGLAFILAAAMLPATAYSQDAATQQRLDRIERDLNMLQRQVYRGAPTVAPGPPGAASASAADVEIRMERLEEQIRELTGHVEQIANGLEQLRQRVEQINSDFDVRFNQVSGDVSPGSPLGRPGAPGQTRLAGAGTPSPAPLGLGPPPGAVVPPPGAGAGPSPIFNTLTPPGVGPARQPTPPSTPDAAATDGPPPSGSTTQQFNHAFGLVKQADYAGAEAALKAFIQQHPTDPLAANAQYWLGETYFARNQYAEASAAFAEGYKRYPKGPKAEEDLLKLGMSLARADQKKNACIAFAQLDQQFPNSSAAVKDRASAERKRLGC